MAGTDVPRAPARGDSPLPTTTARIGLFAAIVLLLGVGVATAVVRNRDDSETTRADRPAATATTTTTTTARTTVTRPTTTVPAQGIAPPAPSTTTTRGAAAPTTAAARPPTMPAAPTTTAAPTPGTVQPGASADDGIPNTGGTFLVTGLLLLAAGTVGMGLARRARTLR